MGYISRPGREPGATQNPTAGGGPGTNAAARVGELVSSHVIARPHEDLLKAFNNPPGKANK